MKISRQIDSVRSTNTQIVYQGDLDRLPFLSQAKRNRAIKMATASKWFRVKLAIAVWLIS
jgi:hypothetical protein